MVTTEGKPKWQEPLSRNQETPQYVRSAVHRKHVQQHLLSGSGPRCSLNDHKAGVENRNGSVEAFAAEYNTRHEISCWQLYAGIERQQ